jgi:hypothetical protein
VWRDHLGTSTMMFNDLTPTVVDEHDYQVWRANFGKTRSGLTQGHAVPEPATEGLLMLAAIVLTGWARPPLHARPSPNRTRTGYPSSAWRTMRCHARRSVGEVNYSATRQLRFYPTSFATRAARA